MALWAVSADGDWHRVALKDGKKRIAFTCAFWRRRRQFRRFSRGAEQCGIYHLPVVFVCENNQYAMSFSFKKSCPIERIADRAAGYAMPGETVDGNDVLAVYEAVSRAAGYVRAGNGPALVENVTYRWRGHSKSDANRYRTKEEIESWKAKCPIQRLEKRLLADGLATREELDAVRQSAYQAIEDAVRFAESCPEPRLETIEEGVYA